MGWKQCARKISGVMESRGLDRMRGRKKSKEAALTYSMLDSDNNDSDKRGEFKMYPRIKVGTRRKEALSSS